MEWWFKSKCNNINYLGDFESIKESIYKVVSDVSSTLGEINVVSEEVGKNS